MDFPDESPTARAIRIAVAYGGIDGDHHKAWVIDQMVRALTNCPIEIKEATDWKGVKYKYQHQAESEEYKKLVKDACDGEDGPETYSWEVGIPP